MNENQTDKEIIEFLTEGISQKNAKIASLITTIESLQGDMEAAEIAIKSYKEEVESQKEEIESLHGALEMLPPKEVEIHERTKFQIDKTVDRLLIESLQKDVESLKAITELAVKGLKQMSRILGMRELDDLDIGELRATSDDTLSEIEGLSQ